MKHTKNDFKTWKEYQQANQQHNLICMLFEFPEEMGQGEEERFEEMMTANFFRFDSNINPQI